MDMTLEVILLPVSDVDRAKEFYRDKVGIHVDLDGEVMEGVRIVQLTPPGSGCSIALVDGLEVPTGPKPQPGSYHGMQLCVGGRRSRCTSCSPSWPSSGGRARSSASPTVVHRLFILRVE